VCSYTGETSCNHGKILESYRVMAEKINSIIKDKTSKYCYEYRIRSNEDPLSKAFKNSLILEAWLEQFEY